ncbi:MAG: transmembrane sensor [Phenylobacterium sp.]|jgi:transmembrane sensor
MSNIYQIHEQSKLKQAALATEEQRLDDASDWIAKLDRGLSGQEKKSLQQWLAADPENTVVLLEVAKLWDKMDDLARLSDIFPEAAVNKTYNNAHQTSKSRWIGGIAASFAMALTLAVYQVGFQADPAAPSTLQPSSAIVAMQTSYQTDVGESNTINLPDNSKIVLNTNSFVQVKYTDKARFIELLRGEMHIEVAHDTTRPLNVIAGGKIIQAVGTAFNVEVRNKLVELIVTDGKVRVASQKNASLNADVAAMEKRLPVGTMAISKGEKVDLDISGQSAEKVVKLDALQIAESLSWRHGNLIFRGESLADAMAEISRYTQIEFELSDDEKLRQVQVAGMFKTGDVTGLLDVLSRNFNIRYEKVSHNKIILNYDDSRS